MKRKIIKQGHNTLTLTLPAKWVQQFNLRPGSEVDVIEKENGLFITTEKNQETKKTKFNIDDMDIPTIWEYFMAAYREGYDEILVEFSSTTKLESPYKYFAQNKLDLKYGNKKEKKSILEFMHETVNRFIGFEITDYGEGFVLIKEMTTPTSKEFDTSLRRVFLLVQQMAEETCDSLKKGNFNILSHIHDVDINLDKFHDYCIRILNKTNHKEEKKTCILFSTLMFLELVGDEFKTISHHLVQDFQKVKFKNIIDIADSIKEQFDLFYNLFYHFDKDKILQISEIDSARYFNVGEKSGKIKTEEEKEIFHHLRIIARYIIALVELRIEMEF